MPDVIAHIPAAARCIERNARHASIQLAPVASNAASATTKSSIIARSRSPAGALSPNDETSGGGGAA
ncbi:MAG: hypothetical protein CVT72_10200 [Alphaproteobacteria bacterium HGW-Alphaproteobacteria-11]|nr:MAG: hypothetical protein CVT72_10200 [Alphaproteobacteria bacterium HGW-Alphaproteobacteria-11]